MTHCMLKECWAPAGDNGLCPEHTNTLRVAVIERLRQQGIVVEEPDVDLVLMDDGRLAIVLRATSTRCLN